MVGSIIFAVLCMVITLIFCWLRSSKATFYSLTLKILASLCFIFSAIIALSLIGFDSTVGILILVGLICGLAGDILLDLKVMYPAKNDVLFLTGTMSFAIGHVFYFVALLLINISTNTMALAWAIPVSVVLAVGLTLIILFSSKKMGMDFGKVKWVVIGYSIILSFMFFYSVCVAILSPMVWIFAAGMLVFLLSDLILSMQYFGGKTQKSFIYYNHILYYLAQVMFALFILFGL